VARALLVGCGCRGRVLGAELLGQGWAVRGTSRTDEGAAAIEAAGIEPAIADPERPGTVLDLVGDVAVIAWLLGSASGEPQAMAAIHGPRLASLLEKLVDTPVRGFLYEARGSVPVEIVGMGTRLVEEASERWRIPHRILSSDPGDPSRWTRDARLAVAELVG